MTNQRLLDRTDHLLAKKQDRKLKSLLVKQDFHQIASIIDHLPKGKLKVFNLLPPEIQSEVALVLLESTKRFVFPRLSDFKLARMLHFNDEDDAVDILQFLPHARRDQILEKLKESKRIKLKKLLTYHPETAGGLMDLNFIIVKPDFTLKDVADKVEKHVQKQKQAPLVVVTDEKANIIGYIPYRSFIFRSTKNRVPDLVQRLPIISYKTDQEQILKAIIKERADVLGVVNDNNQVIGIIHARDLIRVVQSEATEDIYLFAGLSREESALDSPKKAVKNRYRWLIVNLGTAMVASIVVAQFESTIAQMAILAAYMPIVAGLGGNAGTQTLAVVVRGLALGEVSWNNASMIIKKEMAAGLVDGLIVGSIAAFIASVLSFSPAIGFVLASAIIINLIMAGFIGALIPLMLKAFRVDPAVASAVFVTATTDAFGFLIFLGLATLILL